MGARTAPSPEPSYSNDPFAPDPTIWPEAPSWLFPTVMTFFAIVLVGVIVLVVMWRKSVRLDREAREARQPTEWVDLSKLDKRGRWDDDEPTS